MSGHILIAVGDKRAEARELLERLTAAKQMGDSIPDVDQQGDSTVVVMDQKHEFLIPEFEKIGFNRHVDEDTI